MKEKLNESFIKGLAMILLRILIEKELKNGEGKEDNEILDN